MPHSRTGRGPSAGALTYGPAGATRPADEPWPSRNTGLRPYARTVVIGRGEADWQAAADAVLRWGVKRRSGFTVSGRDGAGERVVEGAEYQVTAAFGPCVVREPVRVVAIVDTPDRCGFAYGTLPGHPVSGEEVFIVHRSPDGTVALTIRFLDRCRPARVVAPGVPGAAGRAAGVPATLSAHPAARAGSGREVTRRLCGAGMGLDLAH
ncbi:DUF1990 family protein [Streptomyces sp. NPDC014889]|uniref:DUF1990 family protein n=1 Tax=Streptomyces sp. NPDC014889 TaxID=3364928 RepID=UPI0037005E67